MYLDLNSNKNLNKIQRSRKNEQTNIAKNKEKNLVNGSIIDEYLNGDSKYTRLFGELEITTHKVEGKKVYLYPTIGGYNNIEAYCVGKLSEITNSIETKEQKEVFIIKYAKYMSEVSGNQNIIIETPEQAVSYFNSIESGNYTSCEEIYDELHSIAINGNLEMAGFMFLSQIYEEIYSEKFFDECLLEYFISMIKPDKTITTPEQLLDYLNKQEGTSYNTLKEISGDQYMYMASLGLLMRITNVKVYDGNKLIESQATISEEGTFEIQCTMDQVKKYEFLLTNLTGSKKVQVETKIEKNEYGFYYNTFYRVISNDNGTENVIDILFLNDDICFIHSNEEPFLRGTCTKWNITDEGKISISAFGLLATIENDGKILNINGIELIMDVEYRITVTKNENGFYYNAWYLAENPEDYIVRTTTMYL